MTKPIRVSVTQRVADVRRSEAMMGKVQRALDASGDSDRLEVLELLCVIRLLVLKCKTHGRFELSVNAFVGTNKTPGKRCPQCVPRWVVKGAMSFVELVEKSKAEAGLEPVFSASDVQLNPETLNWRCLENEKHILVGSAESVMAGKVRCTSCIPADQRKRAFSRVKAAITARGDKMLTKAGPRDLCKETQVSFQCGKCKKGISRKFGVILTGKHDCNPVSGAKGWRLEASYKKLVADAAAVGAVIVTSLEEYDRSTCAVRYRLQGDTEVRERPASSLSVRLKELKLRLAAGDTQVNLTQGAANGRAAPSGRAAARMAM